MLGPRLLGQLALLRRPHGADDGGAQSLRPLAQDEADAARRRMDEDGVASLHLESPSQQILRGKSFQHHGRAHLVGNIFGQLHQKFRVDQPLFRIAAGHRGIGHAVAHLKLFDTLADFDHLARALIARRERKLGGIGALAEIDLDEVQPDGVMADLDLSAPGGGNGDVLHLQDFRAAGLVNSDRSRHWVPLRLMRLRPHLRQHSVGARVFAMPRWRPESPR